AHDRSPAEAVRQRREAPVPDVHVHVDHVHAGVAQQGGTTFWSFLYAPQASGVDELDVVRQGTPRRCFLPGRAAQVRVGDRLAAGGPRHVDDPLGRGRILDVDG